MLVKACGNPLQTIMQLAKYSQPTNLRCDIAGGGITGLTTGLLLQKAGKSVLIAGAKCIGFGITGGTTAHLNTMMDTPYATMEKNFGENNTQIVAKSIQAALRLKVDVNVV